MRATSRSNGSQRTVRREGMCSLRPRLVEPPARFSVAKAAVTKLLGLTWVIDWLAQHPGGTHASPGRLLLDCISTYRIPKEIQRCEYFHSIYSTTY